MAFLFDKIPENFFTILASPNKKIYVECLFIIYDAIDSVENSFQGEKNFILEKLTVYFENQKNLLLEQQAENNLNTPRQKANAVLNALKKNGWLGEEALGNYKVSLSFFDYSIQTIALLKKLVQGEKAEYSGDLFTVYLLLTSFEKEQELTIIENAFSKTSNILQSLKTLKANIYRYYFDLVKNKDQDELKKLLEKLLVDYKRNFFDSAYYHLKTTDSLSRYKRSIFDNISLIYNNATFLETLTKQLLQKDDNIKTYEEAFDVIENKIRFIRDSLDNIELLINEIDKKNELYISATVAKIMFLTNNSQNFSGMIEKFLKHFIQQSQKIDYQNIFHLTKIRNLDQESLFTPRIYKNKLEQEELFFDNFIISEEEKRQRISRLLKTNLFSETAINDFVLALLKKKQTTTLKASSLNIENDQDFIRLILIFLFGNSKNNNKIRFFIKNLKEEVNVHNTFFNDFIVCKKE